MESCADIHGLMWITSCPKQKPGLNLAVATSLYILFVILKIEKGHASSFHEFLNENLAWFVIFIVRHVRARNKEILPVHHTWRNFGSEVVKNTVFGNTEPSTYIFEHIETETLSHQLWSAALSSTCLFVCLPFFLSFQIREIIINEVFLRDIFYSNCGYRRDLSLNYFLISCPLIVTTRE